MNATTGLLRRMCAAAFVAMLLVAPSSATTQPGCPVSTLNAARALATKAAAYFKAHGPAASYARFQDPRGGFLSGDLYVFVIGMDGVLNFNARYPQYVGSSLGGPNALGSRVLAIARDKRRGWVRYRWFSPCTGRMEPKISYFIRVGEYVVGAGAYLKLGV